jgi:hypothetical protein
MPRQNDFTVQQHNLTFPVLSDAGSAVAALFGITYMVTPEMQAHYRSILINIPFVNGDHGENTWRLPLPATFVIAQSGNDPLRRSARRPPRPPRPDRTSSPRSSASLRVERARSLVHLRIARRAGDDQDPILERRRVPSRC